MRQTYAIYDPTTGAILRRVSCTPADLPLQLLPEEAATPAPDTVCCVGHRVVEGRIAHNPHEAP
ncbi:hypothetical protein [Caulobacter vibrioides]|uniref:Uncharacterized protein n=1 Tax=Caulobacter phage S2B TaxID=2759120 RepID=A0AAE7ML81_9CAUD|nr:hypothetical protein [Caulobacter vibrioides]QOC54127.1 hypothetical protein [Caulobacter phage S2B]QXZ50194.1 hypothetical protein KZH45_09685 [Caulobacter vibrioides]